MTWAKICSCKHNKSDHKQPTSNGIRHKILPCLVEGCECGNFDHTWYGHTHLDKLFTIEQWMKKTEKFRRLTDVEPVKDTFIHVVICPECKQEKSCISANKEGPKVGRHHCDTCKIEVELYA